jgi:ribosomal protein L11 methyltransferase
MRYRAAGQKVYSFPYENLYIYYLKGHLSTENELYSNSFIGNWEEDEFSFLFFSQPADDIVQHLLASQPQLSLLDHYQMTYEEWQGGDIKPLSIDRFTILPPWLEEIDYLDSRTIILDPGVVFGTGTHPTTRDCISAIEMALSAVPGGITLDIGTGTGLLAIVAARLGSSKVIAVDLNHLAARTALANVHHNNLSHRILVIRGDAEKCIDLASDLMVSNIHYDVMKHLINSKGFLNNRQFILSGLLRSQAKAISDQLTRYPVRIIKRWAYDGVWHTFYGEVNH